MIDLEDSGALSQHKDSMQRVDLLNKSLSNPPEVRQRENEYDDERYSSQDEEEQQQQQHVQIEEQKHQDDGDFVLKAATDETEPTQ